MQTIETDDRPIASISHSYIYDNIQAQCNTMLNFTIKIVYSSRPISTLFQISVVSKNFSIARLYDEFLSQMSGRIQTCFREIH